MRTIEKRLRRQYEELMFYGNCAILNEFAGQFRTLLQLYGIPWTEEPEGEYHIIFTRGPLNR